MINQSQKMSAKSIHEDLEFLKIDVFLLKEY